MAKAALQLQCDLALQITALDTQGGSEEESKARVSSLLELMRRQGVVPSQRSLECLCWRSVFEESADPVGVLPYVYEYISEYRRPSDPLINPFSRYLDHALADGPPASADIIQRMRALVGDRKPEPLSVKCKRVSFEEEISYFLLEKRTALREEIEAECEAASRPSEQQAQTAAAGALPNGAEAKNHHGRPHEQQQQQKQQKQQEGRQTRRKQKGAGSSGIDFRDPEGALPLAKEVALAPLEDVVRHALEHPEYSVPKIVPKSMRRKAEEAARIIKRLRTRAD